MTDQITFNDDDTVTINKELYDEFLRNTPRLLVKEIRKLKAEDPKYWRLWRLGARFDMSHGRVFQLLKEYPEEGDDESDLVRIRENRPQPSIQ